MKSNIKKYLFIVLIILLAFSCCFAIKFMRKTASAQTEEAIETTKEFTSFCGNAKREEESNNAVTFSGNGYQANYDSLSECLDYDYRNDHGYGRENGGTRLLFTGCRNYKGVESNSYGTTDIPYWINQKKLSNIKTAKQKNIIMANIRSSAELWNQANMYDSTGRFVNFYEIVSTIKPSDVNGRKVVEIVPEYYDRENKNDGTFGEYSKDDNVITLYYEFSDGIMTSPCKTVAHEFGHVLGLSDLDVNCKETGYTDIKHYGLMGYATNIFSDNLDSIMFYQDIQGAAVINNRHVCNNASLMRYVYYLGYYKHICFYCDRIFNDQNIMTGSKPIEDSANCSHDYQHMISCGVKRWEKCTKCYKVIESDWQYQNGNNVTLTSVGNMTQYFGIKAEDGKAMPSINKIAPKKDGWVFDGYFDIAGNKYFEMRVAEDQTLANENQWDIAYSEQVFPVNGVIWPYRANTALYANWIPMECNYTYNNVGDGNYLTTTTVHLIHGNVTFNAANIDGYDFQHFTYEGKEYSSPATINIKLYRDANGNIRPTGTLVAIYSKHDDGGKCLAAGSMITLADGSRVAVENLEGDEWLLVWNLYTGTYDTAPILFIDNEPLSVYKVINLSFSDGSTVKVISEHGFWDYNLNKYVYLDENAEEYIGHWFNKGETKVQLTEVEIKEEYTSAWSHVTYGHLCYFVNGMLSMPGGIDGLFNIFDVDAETMKYDEVSMQLDIETYGLFTYEEFAMYLDVPEEVFNAFNAQYFKVAIGKGLITVDELSSLYERYADLLA